MKNFYCGLCLGLTLFWTGSCLFFNVDNDAGKNVSQLITSKGYPVEEYNVTTGDSYVIMIQRIPAGRDKKREDKDRRKPVAFLMSGLLGSSADYVVNLPNQSLGFILADNGFDVWLGNVRGTKYSSHLRLNESDEEYWNFSFDQMIQHDLPSQIDAILLKTQQEALLYVGFSQGSLIMFGLLADRQAYNTKVLLVSAIAPVAYLGHQTSRLKQLLPFWDHLAAPAIQSIFKGAVFASSGIMKNLEKTFCEGVLHGPHCTVAFYFINGGLPIEMNETRLPVYMTNNPAGTSVRNLQHFAQLLKSDHFQKFDWGEKKNIDVYGQPTPRQYNLSQITAPVALYWSDGDVLATPTDVEHLARNLRNLVIKYKVPIHGFTHLDFVWSIKAKNHLYKEMMSNFVAFLQHKGRRAKHATKSRKLARRRESSQRS